MGDMFLNFKYKKKIYIHLSFEQVTLPTEDTITYLYRTILKKREDDLIILN